VLNLVAFGSYFVFNLRLLRIKEEGRTPNASVNGLTEAIRIYHVGIRPLCLYIAGCC